MKSNTTLVPAAAGILRPAAEGFMTMEEPSELTVQQAQQARQSLHAQRVQRARRARQMSRAFTLIELMIVMEVIMILAGMALPNIKTSRKAAAETSAVLTLRQLSDAQELYRPRQSPPAYAPDLDTLRKAGLIDEGIAASHRKSGYFFMVSGLPDQNGYAFTAIADVQGSTGDRSFYVDQSGVIRMASDASVSPFSPALQ